VEKDMKRTVLVIMSVAFLSPLITAQVSQPVASPRDRVEAYVREWHAQSSVPGVSVGIVLKDGSALTAVAGVADRTAKTSLTPAGLMLAGSTGKTFFAALALQLIESGRLDLDAPVSKYLGDVPARLGPQTSYGLGVIVRPTTPVGQVWGHSGFFPGYQSELVYAVDKGITVAVQINSSAPRSTGSRSMLRVAYDLIAMF
jgi:CubicO group peptidase (beta-lactamase class C family)